MVAQKRQTSKPQYICTFVLANPYIRHHDMATHTTHRGMTMETTPNLDDQVLMNAKKRATKDGITLNALVEDALKAKFLQYAPKVSYQFKPKVITGTKPPNVDISERDSLYEVTNNS